MRKLYQTEWFGIEFREFAQMSKHHVADSAFYAAFYDRFRNRYRGYDELPIEWRRGKDAVAAHLAELLDGRRTILSIGSGIGYVETRLGQLFHERGATDVRIVALEPGPIASYFPKPENVESLTGLFPQAVAGRSFDAVYAANIDYCFDDDQYYKLLRSVYEFGATDLILTNIIVPPASRRWIAPIKSAAKSLLAAAGWYEYGQFWGYLREIPEHEKLIRRAGFQIVGSGEISQNGCWLRAQGGSPTSPGSATVSQQAKNWGEKSG